MTTLDMDELMQKLAALALVEAEVEKQPDLSQVSLDHVHTHFHHQRLMHHHPVPPFHTPNRHHFMLMSLIIV